MSKTDSSNRRAVARSAARLGAVQALYQMELAQTPVSQVKAEFSSSRLGEEFENGECGQADVAFLQTIIDGVVREQERIDKAVNACLREDWRLNRLDATARAILRSGAFELIYCTDIPTNVAISEYVDLAHAFFEDGSEPGFINAALDKLAQDHPR